MSASRPVPPSPRTNQPSRLYDSRRAAPGIGFPSLSRSLVRVVPNTRDPHDYYAELGVDPAAPTSVIRAAVRRLFVALHPDTGEHPDPERLQRVKLISDVLLDDRKRIKYDQTPEGERVMDEVYRSELINSGLLDGLSEKRIRETLKPSSKKNEGNTFRFDYFSIGHKTTDALKAQQWYHHLLVRASSTSFRGRLRLLLWDGDRSAWDGNQEILMVPRRWEPSAFAAETLLTKVIGSVGVSNITTSPPQVSPTS